MSELVCHPHRMSSVEVSIISPFVMSSPSCNTSHEKRPSVGLPIEMLQLSSHRFQSVGSRSNGEMCCPDAPAHLQVAANTGGRRQAMSSRLVLEYG